MLFITPTILHNERPFDIRKRNEPCIWLFYRTEGYRNCMQRRHTQIQMNY